MTPSPTRVCPICGVTMARERCPNDGVKMMRPQWVYSILRAREPGELVGERYVVKGDIVTGTNSRVYIAQDTVTQRLIALKMLAVDPELRNDPIVSRFLREARTVARLSSVHSVTLFDVGVDDGVPYMVYDLVHGRLLDKMLERLRNKHRKLSPAAACELAAGILRSLAEAHESGIIHRNVSPSHVALAHTGCGELTVKMLGFGSVRSKGSKLTREGVIGVPAYMSPEQVQNKKLDGRADLYSLGVVLYRCVSGKLPFSDKKPFALMSKHVNEQPIPLELTEEPGPAVGRFIHRLMAKNPADRHRTALDALVTLQAISGRRLHAVPHLATLDGELDDGFGEHLVDSSGNPNDFLDAKTNVYGLSPIARVGPAKQSGRN